MLLVDSILLLSHFVQISPLAKEKGIPPVSGILARLVVAKVEGDRGRSKKGKGRGRSGTRDGPSNSQVCFKCGSGDHWARDCPKMDVGPSNLKKRNLGAYVDLQQS